MKIRVLLGGLVLVCSLAACGHDRGPRRDPTGEAPRSEHGGSAAVGDLFLFVGFDRDADYQVTFEEVNAGIDSVFDQADSDGNGALTQVEYSAWAAKGLGDAYAEPYFPHLDTDRNLLLSRQEFTQSIYERARRHDKNQDNVLTFAELRPALRVGELGSTGGSGSDRRRRRGSREGGRRRGGGNPW